MNKRFRHINIITLLAIIIASYSCNYSSTPKTKELSYEGISFSYSQSWKTETENYSENAYFIEAKDRDNTIMVFFSLNSPSDPTDIVESYLEKIKKEKFDVSAGAISSGKFGKYNSQCADLLMTAIGQRIYSKVYALEIEGKTILIVEQSDTERRLERNFKTIEDSFHVEETDSIQNSETGEE